MLSACLVLLICLPIILFNNQPYTDVSIYAPMISALGRGDFAYAFYPRIPPLFVICGAPFAWLGADGYTAAKITSSLFLALSVFPLFALMKRVFDSRIAALSIWLMPLFPSLMNYSAGGLRESMKVFFLLLMTYGAIVFVRDRRWWPPALIAVGVAGLSLTWGGGIFLGALFFVFLFVMDYLQRQWGWRRFTWPLRSVGGLVLVLIFLSPWIGYVYQQTGYPLTDMRHIYVLKRLGSPLERLGLIGSFRLPPEPSSLVERHAEWLARKRAYEARMELLHKHADHIIRRDFMHKLSQTWNRLWEHIITEVLNGLVVLYLAFGIPVAFYRIRQRLWRLEESMLVAIVAAYLALLLGVLGWINVRYVSIATPLTLGWAAMGMLAVVRWTRAHFSRAQYVLLQVVAAVAVVAALIEGMDAIWPNWKQHDRDHWNAIYAASHFLRTEGAAMVPEGQEPLVSTARLYHTGRLPVVMCGRPAVALLADADSFTPVLGRHIDVLLLPRYCEAKQVNFLYIDNTFRKICPDTRYLSRLPAEFVVLLDLRGESGNGGVLVGYKPNLNLPDD